MSGNRAFKNVHVALPNTERRQQREPEQVQELEEEELWPQK